MSKLDILDVAWEILMKVDPPGFNAAYVKTLALAGRHVELLDYLRNYKVPTTNEYIAETVMQLLQAKTLEPQSESWAQSWLVLQTRGTSGDPGLTALFKNMLRRMVEANGLSEEKQEP